MLVSLCAAALSALSSDAPAVAAAQDRSGRLSSTPPRSTASSTQLRPRYIRRAIAEADAAKADLLVIVLRTPGGLVDSTRDINTAIIQSKTPVAVFVSPSGSRAASAGFLITIAADIAAMAPGTHIGAAHPVSGDGQKVDDDMAKKMTSDVAGYARTLAAQRKRNVALVEQAVTESRTYTEQEASTAEPPLIDVIASDLLIFWPSSMGGPSIASTAPVRRCGRPEPSSDRSR